MQEMRPAKPDQTALAIGIILASVLTMAFADAVVKLVSADLTVWQVFVARSVFAIPCLIAILPAMGVGFRLASLKWALIRSALLVLTWLFFYASLPVLSLSVAAVAVYTNPIITALLSAVVIGERVSPRQWAGVLLGFLGVIAILKPGTDAFSWFTVLPLIAAACYSLAMVLTRSKCQDEQPLVLGLALHCSFLVTGVIAVGILALIGLDAGTTPTFPFLFNGWTAMGAREWGLMALIGVLSAAYFVGVAHAYQIAPPSVIGTFDYAYLVSAAVWGFIFFAETPDVYTICGMVLITAAGLLVAVRPANRVVSDQRS
ncbi:DMT family transporter [Anderseniella sp. Alg231-50]|uniref:DMT family transporter n=1 Tax=Anderseniella sp. Alg231-50 TaxID=1922226 RepID=UPI00307C03CB